MTPQEEQLLNALAERVNSTQLQEKDPDAEAFLYRSFSSNPDVLYILAQTVLVQNIALEQAKAQVVQLEQQIQQVRQQPAHTTSFLGSLLGHRDPAPAPPPALEPAPSYRQAQFQPVQAPNQPMPQPQYVPVQPQYVPVAQDQPSFLRGAVQTAAGVAAGALAFEGVEAALHGIMGHPGYGWGGPALGMGGFGVGGGFERPVEETVVNNYYDQPGGASEHHEQHDQADSGSGEQRFHESAEQNFDRGGAQFSDASYNTQGNERNNANDAGENFESDDNSGFDDGNQDDSSFDDSSSFGDGGGGFDSGSGSDLA